MYQILGILGICICVAAIASVLAKDRDLTRSISHHAAREPHVHRLFAVTMTIGMALIAASTLCWFVPHFDMPWIFTSMLILALVLETITTWVPLTQGWKFTVHQTASYTVAALIPILLAIIASTDTVSPFGRIVSLIGTAVILAFIALFFTIQGQRQYYLVYQTTYVAIFFISLMGAILL